MQVKEPITKESIKRTLNSYRFLKAELQQILQELERVNTLLSGPSSPNMDGMPKGSMVSNPVESMALKHIALQEKYMSQVEELTAAQTEIENMIAPLEPTERILARYRYIEGLAWEEVCVAMNYSWRQTHRIHSQMLTKLLTLETEKVAG